MMDCTLTLYMFRVSSCCLSVI